MDTTSAHQTQRTAAASKARRRSVIQLRKRYRALVGRPAPSRTPLAALRHVVDALEARTQGKRPQLQTSRYGAAGGLYFARVEPRPPGKKDKGRRKPPKLRRLDRTRAHQVLRRDRSPELHKDRISAVWWVPPELLLLYDRTRLRQWVERGMVRPVWQHDRGRVLWRGDPAVR